MLFFYTPKKATAQINYNAKDLYNACDLKQKTNLNLIVFETAIKGYKKMVENGTITDLTLPITIIDYSLPSTKKRLYTIDLQKQEILFFTYVAHGKNTGENTAENFSNEPKSLKSCLGFFKTGETYNGKHGFSLYLHGLEKGFNDNALSRAIVMHGAYYVSEAFAKSEKRMGRSWGCPALSLNDYKPIINTIKNGSCLFIYANNTNYLNNSLFLK